VDSALGRCPRCGATMVLMQEFCCRTVRILVFRFFLTRLSGAIQGSAPAIHPFV
jgi:hypothetical protein